MGDSLDESTLAYEFAELIMLAPKCYRLKAKSGVELIRCKGIPRVCQLLHLKFLLYARK